MCLGYWHGNIALKRTASRNDKIRLRWMTAQQRHKKADIFVHKACAWGSENVVIK